MSSSLWDNPILVSRLRARMRVKSAIAWGTVVLIMTAFLVLMTYFGSTRSLDTTAKSGARAALVPIIVIQAVILMLAGTGAVASSLARERDSGLLDYQRMTPMTASAKILGYLFGLPAREYVLFSLTLPFLAFVILVGEIPILVMAQFYAVFLTSVWVYHLTGMMAGMISTKPWRAAMLSQGTVILLYVLLPTLSQLGITAFEFLTIRPALGLLSREVWMTAGNDNWWALVENVPFFDTAIHPILFTLIVQGVLIVAMYTIVHRKWRDQLSHPFSKIQALAFFMCAGTLIIGSVWAMIADRAFLRQVTIWMFELTPRQSLYLLIAAQVIVIGALCMLLIHIVTPTKATQLMGLRRAAKHGLARTEANSDAASSFRLTIVFLAMSCLAFASLIWRAGQRSDFFEGLPPFIDCAAPAILFAATLLFVQGLRERLSSREMFFALFILWIVPGLVSLLMLPFEQVIPAAYISIVSAPMALLMTVYLFFTEFKPVTQSDFLEGHLPRVVWLSVGLYVLLAAAAQMRLRKWKGNDLAKALAMGPRLSPAEVARAGRHAEPGDLPSVSALSSPPTSPPPDSQPGPGP